MKEFDLFGLGNALVDIFLEVPDEEFAAARVRAGHHAAGRSARTADPARPASATTSRGWSAAGPSPTRSSRARNSAATRPSSAASATTATACTTGRVRRSSTSTSATRPSSARPPAPASASSRPTPSGPMRTCLAVSSHLAARHVDADADRGRGVAVRRGLRVRQPAHRPARHPRGGQGREGARHEGRADLLRRVHPAGVRRRLPRGAGRPTCCSATRPRRAP